MPSPQFPENELGSFYTKAVPSIKKRKLLCFLGWLLFIFYFSIPSFQIPVLEYNSYRFTSLMEQRALENKLLFYPAQSYINIKDVSPLLLRGIISMEDGSFFYHKGIDWKEFNTAIRIFQAGRRTRGGSTITMQTAKNLFLTTEKSILRKGKEFLITARMEKELTKKAILENYINAVEWGDGIFGVKEAASFYFNKEPSELNLNEASRMAAVIPSPLKYKPNENSNYVLRRSAIIRSRLNDVILFPDKKDEDKRIKRANRKR